MKKLNVLFISVLLSLFLVSCGNLFNQDKENENKYNLTVHIKNGGNGKSARTITSASGWDVSTLDWIVEFYDLSAKKVEPVTVSADGNSFELVPGDYVVKASAVYESHTIYGEKEVIVEEGVTTSVSIAVGLKKTENGTGSIGKISVDLTDALSKVSLSSGSSAKLVPAKSGEDEIDLSVSVPNYIAEITYSGTIPSGYYYLQVELPGIYGSEDMVNLVLNDAFVEIADGETVNATLKALDGNAYATYYASYVGSGNGLTPSNRISYGNLLTALKNKGSMRYVTVYFDENLAFDLDELSEIPAASEDDYVNFIITTNYYTYQIIYSCYKKTLNYAEGNVHLRVNNGNVKDLYVESSPYGNLSTLDLHNKATVGLLDYSNSEDNPIYFICDHSADNHGTFSCNATLADYYKGTGVPFLTNVVNSTEPLAIDVDDINCEVVYTVEDVPENSGCKLYSYYLAPTGSADISVSNAIPDFDIAVTIDGEKITSGSTVDFDNSSISFDAKIDDGIYLKTDDASLELSWSVNGHIVESTGANGGFSINPATTSLYLNPNGSNIVQCVATKNGSYKSRTFDLKLESNYRVVYYDKENSDTIIRVVVSDDMKSIANNASASMKLKCGEDYKNVSVYRGLSQTTAFGSNGYIAFLTIDYPEDKEYLKYYFPETSESDTVAINTSNNSIAVDTSGEHDKVYILGNDSLHDYMVTSVSILEDGNFGTPVSVPLIGTSLSFDTDTITAFAVYNDVLYVSTYNQTSRICTFYQFNYDTESPSYKKTKSSSVYDLINDGHATAQGAYFFGITDFYVDKYTEDLYFIIREGIELDPYSVSNLHSSPMNDKTTYFPSRGCLAKMKINADGSTTLDSDFGLFGWSNKREVQVGGKDVFNPDVNASGFNGFFGPVKIIAIKRKELVIQDIGAYLATTDEYAVGLKGENRFVKVNLKDKTATYEKSSTPTKEIWKSGSSASWDN